MSLPTLRDFDKEYIKRPFTEEEVIKALRDCYGDKAPSPDGMAMAFLQFNWNTVKIDVMRMFSEFFSSKKFVSSVNATFIGLIPKKLNAESITDFRPISLLGCIYKLLSKVLALRLRGVLGDLQVNRMPLLEVVGFLMRCFKPMSLLISESNRGRLGLYVSWILKRHMIM